MVVRKTGQKGPVDTRPVRFGHLVGVGPRHHLESGSDKTFSAGLLGTPEGKSLSHALPERLPVSQTRDRGSTVDSDFTTYYVTLLRSPLFLDMYPN